MHHAYLHNIKRGGGRDKGKDGERGRRKERDRDSEGRRGRGGELKRWRFRARLARMYYPSVI